MHLPTRLRIALLMCLVLCLTAPVQPVQAQEKKETAGQILTLSHEDGQPSYALAIYANHDLNAPDTNSHRAVIIIHGVRRNAADYFLTGTRLLQLAGLNPADTLLLAPHFMARTDRGAVPTMPLWGGGSWMQGEPSRHGIKGVGAFDVLDDIARMLADRARFPALKEIVLIGHSAGAQLMQRYAMLNNIDGTPPMAGVTMRYVVSSPSSYLYLDGNRVDHGRVDLPADAASCPPYNRYRYGLDHLPVYLGQQQRDGEALFRRYAARNVTYMVGQRDTDPAHRFLDKSCGAMLQGATRVDRQHNYRRYEAFLSAQWHIPIVHPGIDVPDAGHAANVLFGNAPAARQLFPTDQDGRQ